MAVRAEPDRWVAQRAERQHGLVTGADARRAGLTHSQVQARVLNGRWRRLARDLFAVAGSVPTTHQAILAACLAGPVGTVASHFSAAFLFGLLAAPKAVHVTVGPTSSNRSQLAVVHRAHLSRADRSRIGVIPVTTPARTLVDLAARLESHQYVDVLDAALVKGLATWPRVLAALERAGTRNGPPGAALVRHGLEPWATDIPFESVAEVRLLRRLRSWCLPDPVGQHVILDEGGRFVARVDFAWVRPMVVLEYQGRAHHGPRQAPLDEARIAKLQALGWRVEEARAADLEPGSTRLREVLGSLLRDGGR